MMPKQSINPGEVSGVLIFEDIAKIVIIKMCRMSGYTFLPPTPPSLKKIDFLSILPSKYMAHYLTTLQYFTPYLNLE